MALTLVLPDADATLELGRSIGRVMTETGTLVPVFLNGDLGSGKTTLVRGLVDGFPGSEEAEVASPSFNIVNHYPTAPPVAHFDLYRLEGMPPGDEFYECLNDKSLLTVVEWSQYLSTHHLPGDVMILQWRPIESGRQLDVSGLGSATALVDALRQITLKFLA